MYKLWVRWEASLFIRRQRHVSPTMVAKTGEETHMYTAPLVGTRARWRESLGFQSVQTPLPDCWFHVLWDASSVTQSGLLRITRSSLHYVTPVGLSQGKVQSRSWWCNQRSRPASIPMRTFCLRSTKTKNTQHKLLRLVLQIFTDFPKGGNGMFKRDLNTKRTLTRMQDRSSGSLLLGSVWGDRIFLTLSSLSTFRRGMSFSQQ